MSVKDVLLGWGFLRWKRRHNHASEARPAGWAPPPREAAKQEAKTAAAAQAHEKTPARGFRGALRLLKDALSEWSADKAPRLGAALSYYTVFALAPLLLVVISVAGLAFGQEAAQGRILGELQDIFGRDTALMVQKMLAKSAERGAGVLGTVVGLATLLLGATAVMIELESALDAIWKVAPKPRRGVKGLVKERLLSLGLILSLGFLLLVSLVASALLSAFGGMLNEVSFPKAALVGQILNNLLSLGIIAAFFALVFKYLTNAKIAWRDVWVGALVTSFLFHVGKIGIGLYLGRASIGSTFGAAGSLAILLVWIYYSAQIVFFGAEITRLYAQRYGAGVRPDEDAVPAPGACPPALPAPARPS
jgi:membrane protein